VHHGVRISDSACVAAATLSDRYITDRFLPDKAIDLVDEAASRIKMEIDSMPIEIDEIERKVRQLMIEQEALKKEKDPASKDRLEKIKEQLANLNEKKNGLVAQWRNEKAIITENRGIKEQIEHLRTEEQRAEREGNLNLVAEIRYGRIAELEKKLAAANKKLKSMQGDKTLLKEEVTEQEIAAVVSRWTGIPVSRMLENASISGWSTRRRRSRPWPMPCDGTAPDWPIRTGPSGRSSSSGRRAWARRSSARPWPRPCSTMRTPWSGST